MLDRSFFAVDASIALLATFLVACGSSANEAAADASGSDDALVEATSPDVDGSLAEAGSSAPDAMSDGSTPPVDASGGGDDASDASDGSEGGTSPDASRDASDASPGDSSADANDAADANAPAACLSLSTPSGHGLEDVTAFGATGNGTTDDTAAIQAAINASCASGNRPAVFLPPGTFKTTMPLLIDCDSFEMYGACRSGTALLPQFGGPAILLDSAGGVIPMTLVPALVGSGNALGTESGHYYLNLRDIPAVELDGLGAFTAEAFIKQSAAYTPGWGGIVGGPDFCQSKGGIVPCSSAFKLGVFIQQLQGILTIGGISHTLVGPTVTLNEVHHVALTFDGAMIRLFLDGALVASQAATGTVTQHPWEDVTVGPTYYPLEASVVDGPMPGAIDSLRLSSVARYTAAFTPPTAKLVSDASTLALTNFDAQSPGLTRAMSKDGPFWLPVRRTQDTSGNSVNTFADARLHDLTVRGGMGIFAWLSVGARIAQVDCLGCDYGFAFFRESYENQFADLTATAGPGRSRFGIYAHTANGNGYHDIRLVGQTTPFVVVSGAEQVHTNISIAAGQATTYAMLLEYSDDVFDGITIDASGAGPAWRGALASLQPWAKLHVQHGTIGNFGSGIPISIDSTVGALIEGTTFTKTASEPEILHNVTATKHPNIVLAAAKDSSVRWSDDTGLLTPAGADPGAVPDVTALPQSDPGPTVTRGAIASSNVFDVTTYGAKGDGTDDYAAIQAAVNAACATRGTVFFPAGGFWKSKPVLVNCDGVTLEGAAFSWPQMRTQGTFPDFVLEPAGMTGVDVGPALVGTGNAMKTDGSSYWLDLRDDSAVDLAGLGSFTAEGFIRMTAASSGYGGVVQSYGCLGTGASLPGCTSAFALATTNQTLIASMTIGSASHALQGPTISLNTVHHVALTYDGSVIRLFLDGALAASQAGTGTLAQAEHEDVTVGPRTSGFDGAALSPAMTGSIDSVRLSNSARYTAAFTPPTAKLGVDGSSLMLLNFDEQISGTTHAIGAGGDTVYLPVRRTAEPNGTPEGTLTGVTLRSLELGGTLGVFGMNAVNGRYLGLRGAYCDETLTLDGDSHGSLLDDLFFETGAGKRWSISTVSGTGSVYRDLRLNYAKSPMVIYGGANQLFVHTFLTPDPATSVYGAYFLHAGVTLEGLYLDNEGTMPLGKGDVVAVDSITPFTLFKGEIDVAAGMIPITIDGGKGFVLEGTSFGNTSTSPELVHVSAPVSGLAEAIGVTADSAALLCDYGALVSIGN